LGVKVLGDPPEVVERSNLEVEATIFAEHVLDLSIERAVSEPHDVCVVAHIYSEVMDTGLKENGVSFIAELTIAWRIMPSLLTENLIDHGLGILVTCFNHLHRARPHWRVRLH